MIRCCKDCLERTAECHATCERYKAEKAEAEKLRLKRNKEKEAEAFEYEIRARFSTKKLRKKNTLTLRKNRRDS